MWLNIYCGHPNCKTPDDDVIIWRYIKFETNGSNGIKIYPFRDMLKTNCLHFTRADQFPDGWEGTPSIENPTISKFLNKCRKRTVINCWQINKFESHLMWETYVGKEDGIVIQSSIKKLKDGFEKSVGNKEFIGKVNYCESLVDLPTEKNGLQPVLRKRCQYKEEAEVRVIFKSINDVFDKNGINIPVYIDKLIEKIYISPKSYNSFLHEIKYLLKKYKLNIEVLPSELSKKPKIDSKDSLEGNIIYKDWGEGDHSFNVKKIDNNVHYTKE